jgi:hypothetical protein
MVTYEDILEALAWDIKNEVIKALSPYLPLFISLVEHQYAERAFYILVAYRNPLVDIKCTFSHAKDDDDPESWRKQYFIRVIDRPRHYLDTIGSEFCFSDPDATKKVCEQVVKIVRRRVCL